MKQCTKCKEWKEEIDFYKSPTGKNGLNSHCKLCNKLKNKKYYEANKEKIAKKSNEYRKVNRSKLRQQYKNFYRNHREERKASFKKYAQRNKEKIKVRMKKWTQENKEHLTAYRKSHRDKLNQKAREYNKIPKNRLNARISAGIRFSLKGNKNGSHWEKLVGYTLKQLMSHLEKQFSKGMTWDKFVKRKIHIDHIIPVSAFNFQKPEDIDFKRCWALKNLRPLWAEENMCKNAKLIKPFQPSLIF